VYECEYVGDVVDVRELLHITLQAADVVQNAVLVLLRFTFTFFSLTLLSFFSFVSFVLALVVVLLLVVVVFSFLLF